MRIYVASKFENPRAPIVAAQLEAAGHVITYKWWGCSNFVQAQALLDFEGVLSADALVLVVENDYRYSGALTEFGMALARGIPVYIMGNAIDRNIFTLMPNVYRGIETLLQATASAT
jgi:hypothetical protein